MTQQAPEEAQKLASETFKKVSDILQGKSLAVVLTVLINTIRTCLEYATPEQKQIIIVTILDNIGMDTPDEPPEETIQ